MNGNPAPTVTRGSRSSGVLALRSIAFVRVRRVAAVAIRWLLCVPPPRQINRDEERWIERAMRCIGPNAYAGHAARRSVAQYLRGPDPDRGSYA